MPASKALMERVFAVVSDALKAGEPCPSNREIAARLGITSQSAPSDALLQLEAQGRLVVERSRQARRVWLAGDPAAPTERAPKPEFGRGSGKDPLGLRARRAALGLTRSRLARAAGITVQRLEDIEIGRSRPDVLLAALDRLETEARAAEGLGTAPPPEAIGPEIRALRQRLGLGGVDAAQLVDGCSPRALYKAENGNTPGPVAYRGLRLVLMALRTAERDGHVFRKPAPAPRPVSTVVHLVPRAAQQPPAEVRPTPAFVEEARPDRTALLARLRRCAAGPLPFPTCQYLRGDARRRDFCGRPSQAGSSYCPEHHALCHDGFKEVPRAPVDAGRLAPRVLKGRARGVAA